MIENGGKWQKMIENDWKMMKNGMIAWYHQGYHAYDWKWGATIKYEHRLVLFGVGRHYKIRRGFESLIAVE